MVQCDFDGTVTIGDLSFQILDEYTTVPWRDWFDDFRHGKITVIDYNAKAFSYVQASREELDSFAREHVILRPGLTSLIDTCHEHDIRFFFVSNGMTFYIESVLDMLSIEGIEYAAAQCTFLPSGIKAIYYDAYGKAVNSGFKESFTKKFKEEGYRIAYIGNGLSDFNSASMCDYVFGIESLAAECNKHNVPFKSFDDLSEVAAELIKLA